MPHGTPDWGLVRKSIVYGLDDMGELAVRLGSPHLWDRRGDVLYATDFAEGLGSFRPLLFATDAEVALSAGHSRLGAYAVRIATGSDGQQMAFIHAGFPFQDPSCVGLEFSFGVDDEPTVVRGEVNWFDGDNYYQTGLEYDFGAQEIRYLAPGPAWQLLLAGVERHYSPRPEHTLKLVVDMALNEYVRALLDDLTVDMRGFAVHDVASPVGPHWYFVVTHWGALGRSADAYIDNVIITQNEPR